MTGKCQGDSCHRNAKSGSNYCSDFCAPPVKAPFRRPTSYAPATDSYSSEERSDESEASSDDDEPTSSAPEHLMSEKPERNARKDHTTRTTRSQSPRPEKNTEEEGTDPVQNTTEIMTESALVARPPRQELDEALPNFAGETFRSKSLIGDSVKQLHELMSDVSNVIKKKGSDRIDPQLVNAACNCAKQIGSLLKLQIEYDKSKGATK